ncbi:Ig-like domain repeat protein [Paenibacillus sp. HJGM_3]|uniref:Ig-like domain repeat protein n=1 Tax=Paenibacillus sp. HJGM_3 TaxID=3379816 RepID=UPI00385CE5AB
MKSPDTYATWSTDKWNFLAGQYPKMKFAKPVTVNLGSSVSEAVYGNSVTFTVTVTPGAADDGTPAGTITFKDGATVLGDPVALTNGTASLTTTALPKGSRSITALYSGDSVFASGNSSAKTVTVYTRIGTQLTLTSSVSSAVYGQPVTYTVQVTPVTLIGGVPTGTVEFKEGSTTLGTATLNAQGVAQWTTADLSVGAHNIWANYLGADIHGGNDTSSISININPVPTNVTLTSTVIQTVYGAPVTLTAAVTPGQATGTITFKDGTIVLGGPVALTNGTASLTTTALPEGSHTITAQYSGDSVFSSGNSSATTVTVYSRIGTQLMLTSSVNSAVYGQPVTYNVLVTPVVEIGGVPSGTVEFKEGSTTLGTATLNAQGEAQWTTFDLSVGAHNIWANYLGAGIHGSNDTPSNPINILPAPTIVTLSTVTQAVYGRPATITATVTAAVYGRGVPSGTVKFFEGSLELGESELDGEGKAIYMSSTLSLGTHMILAMYSGDSAFTPGLTPTPFAWTVLERNNAALSGLALLAGSSTIPLKPAFEAERLYYEATVPNNVDRVQILATAEDEYATILVNGVGAQSGLASSSINLNVGLNPIEVKVVAQNNYPWPYTVDVTRSGSPDAQLSGLSLKTADASGTPIALRPAFTAGNLNYTASVGYDVSAVQVTSVTNSVYATLTVNDVAVASGAASHSLSLQEGPNTIVVKVTAQDGTPLTYTVVVNREAAPSTGSNPAPTVPTTGTRQVDVVVGDNQSVAAKVDITRSTENGLQVDTVKFDEKKAEESINKALAAGQTVTRIVIDDLPNNPADEVKVDLPKSTIGKLKDSDVTLEIATKDVKITLSQDTLEKLSGDNKDFFFRIVPINKPEERKQTEDRAVTADQVKQVAQGGDVDVVGKPMTIETNYSSRATKVEFPLAGINLPTDPQELQRFLDGLSVYIEHSDGEKALQRGTIIYDKAGKPVGLEITIEKFSTFTIVSVQKPAMTYEKYIFGYEDGTFRPEAPITRAEIAAILARNSKQTVPAAPTAAYTDVPASHWASGYIAALQSTGVMNGYDGGVFRPDAPITRAELAKLAAALAEVASTTAPVQAPVFADSTGHWAEASIAKVQAISLMQGYADGLFHPDGQLTRAEAVTVLNRLYHRPHRSGVTKSTWSDVSLTHWASADVESASTTFTQ